MQCLLPILKRYQTCWITKWYVAPLQGISVIKHFLSPTLDSSWKRYIVPPALKFHSQSLEALTGRDSCDESFGNQRRTGLRMIVDEIINWDCTITKLTRTRISRSKSYPKAKNKDDEKTNAEGKPYDHLAWQLRGDQQHQLLRLILDL